MTTREAETYGQALARLSPDAALALFEDWTHERRLMERLVPMPHDWLLRWAAVAGLGILQGAKPAQLVEKVAEQSDAALRRHCEAVLARREKERG